MTAISSATAPSRPIRNGRAARGSPSTSTAISMAAARVGGWRLLSLFRRFGVKVCLLAVAKAAERNPELVRAYAADGHEIVSHGYRRLDYQVKPEEIEREHGRLRIAT